MKLYKRELQTHIKIIENKIKLSEIDNEINDLLSKVIGANSVLMEYINKKVEQMDAERKSIQEEILLLTHNQGIKDFDTISNHVDAWEGISFEDKQAVVDALIKVIHIADGNIEITWNI